jgi:hypothetical protein
MQKQKAFPDVIRQAADQEWTTELCRPYIKERHRAAEQVDEAPLLTPHMLTRYARDIDDRLGAHRANLSKIASTTNVPSRPRWLRKCYKITLMVAHLIYKHYCQREPAGGGGGGGEIKFSAITARLCRNVENDV